jgi:hypothetical protein
MNPTPDDNPRSWVECMLIKLREGEATPDEVTQLRELLATNAEARRAYVRAKQMDTLLETSPMQSVAIPVVTMPRAKSSLRWKIATLASAAAAVVALAFLFLGNQANDGRGRDATVAVLHSSFEAVIDGREVLEGEQTMRAGTYKLERGSIGLRFARGAEVVIEGPAAFDLVDAATMHLNQGSLWAHCPEQARGFAVRMPGGRELIDFGTEFGARVDSAGTAEVKVLEGEVKIHDAVAQPIDLTAGKAAGWELTAPPLAMNAAQVKPFQSAAMLAEKLKSAPRVNQQTVVSFAGRQGGEWNLPENWKGGNLPGAHELERAVINQGRVVRVLPGLPPPPHPVDIHVSNGPPPNAPPDGTLEIGGNLECQMLRIATADESIGVVRQSAGTVNVTGSLLAASHEGAPAKGDYILSDGVLNVGHVIALGRLGSSEFALQGSKVVVTADRMNLGQNATLTFVLDSDGAGLIKLRDTLVRHGQAKLVIDGSQYRGGPKTMPLLLCGSALEDKGRFTPKQVCFEGFAGMNPRLAFRPGGIDLIIDAR